jgi:CDP-glucose 4,6-dehydratase
MEDVVTTMSLGTFYGGRKVLVTGHTGFKGSWLARLLVRLGAEVVGFALPPHTQPSLFGLASLDRDITSVLGDVTDLRTLEGVIAAHRPDLVFHLAAQALVRSAYREPVSTFATNVMGTVNVLEACRKTGTVKACVIVTSDKCYENREWLWGYRECDPLGGLDPYSASKACAELATASMASSFFTGATSTAIATARAGNVIGGGDWAEERLLPDIVRAAKAGRPVLIRNPRSTRPWQHVLEPLWGYLLLGERLVSDRSTHAEPWNFGPSDEDVVPVRDVATRFVERLGAGALEFGEAHQGPHEARQLKLDASKARARLGWRPRLGLAQALDLTARWYRGYLADEASAGPLLDEQISYYLELGAPHNP